MQMNVPLLPASSGLDTMGAYAIIALAADPKAAKTRLDQLVAEKQAALDALAKAQEESEKAAAATAAVAQAKADTEAARKHAEANAAERAKLAGVANDLATRKAAVDDARAQLDQDIIARGAKCEEREQALLAREVAAEARERRLAEQEAAAKAAQADYESRRDRLLAAARA